jgi:hypothetical protein
MTIPRLTTAQLPLRTRSALRELGNVNLAVRERRLSPRIYKEAKEIAVAAILADYADGLLTEVDFEEAVVCHRIKARDAAKARVARAAA